MFDAVAKHERARAFRVASGKRPPRAEADIEYKWAGEYVLESKNFCYLLAYRVGFGLSREHLEDIASAVRLQLVAASKTFDPSRGFTFLTYAWRFARQRAVREARKIRCGGVHVPGDGRYEIRFATFALDQPWPDGDKGEDPIDYRSREADPRLAVWCDPDNVRQRQCLQWHFRLILALRYVEGLTLDEVGQLFGLTRERVRQQENEAVRRLARFRNGRRKRRLLEGRPT